MTRTVGKVTTVGEQHIRAQHATRILADADVVESRIRARDLAETVPLTRAEVLGFARAVGELAHNAWQHAGGGTVTVAIVDVDGRRGLRVVVEDHGPGMRDDAAADPTGGLKAVHEGLEEVQVATGPGGTRVEGIRWENERVRDFRDRVESLL